MPRREGSGKLLNKLELMGVQRFAGQFSGAVLDFDYHVPLQNTPTSPFNTEGATRTLTTQSQVLKKLWDLAKDEWA